MKRIQSRHRRGALIVEGAIVLTVAFLFVFGCFEIGLLVVRSNALAESARRGARAAIVRGKTASGMATMGPTTMSFTAGAENDVAAACRIVLPTMAPRDVSVTVHWPEGSNDLEDPVRVTVQYSHEFSAPFLNHWGNLELRSTSQMTVAR